MAKNLFPVSVPANLTELNERIAKVGALDLLLRSRKALLEQRVAETKRAAQSELALIAKNLEREVTAIEMYASAHRSELLVGTLKSVSFASGRIGWRLTPWKVSFLAKGAEKALASLKDKRMRKYLRVVTEIDKEALLKDRPKVDGVKYTQNEEFFVEPNTKPVSVEAMGEVLVVSR